MISSGTTAKATSGTSAVDLFSHTAGTPKANGRYRHFMIVNEGSTAGFFTIDSTNWNRLPAGSTIAMDGLQFSSSVPQIKRDTSDLSGVYAWAW
jgi:hypothetical protein